MDGQVWGVLAGSRTAMLLSADDRRYVDGNDAALSLLGVSREQLRALRIDDLLAKDLRGGLDARWAEFLARGHMTGRSRLTLPSGRRVQLQYSATANILPGRHLSILLDVAEFSPDGSGLAAEHLTAREREVVRLVAQGATTREIATRLYISPTTVDTHVRKAMNRLGARNRPHLIALALEGREI